jgi:hypothetical protein
VEVITLDNGSINAEKSEGDFYSGAYFRPRTSVARSMAALATKLLRLRCSFSAAFSISFRSFGVRYVNTFAPKGPLPVRREGM